MSRKRDLADDVIDEMLRRLAAEPTIGTETLAGLSALASSDKFDDETAIQEVLRTIGTQKQ